MAKKRKHPNCPKCTTGLKHEVDGYYWNDMYKLPNYNYQKLYRISRRKNNRLVNIGWHCKLCGFVVFESRFIGYFADNQELERNKNNRDLIIHNSPKIFKSRRKIKQTVTN